MLNLKWAILATLGALVLAVILLQQNAGEAALVLAVAGGWFLANSYAAWRGRRFGKANTRASRPRAPRSSSEHGSGDLNT